jgi:hypothetical protein
MSRSRVAPRLWIYGFTPWLISADAAPRQSTLTPLALIGAAHFTISLCTNIARYSGVARSSETNLRSALSSFSRTAGGRALCAIWEGNREDLSLVTGYNVAQAMVHVLKECSDDLTRANIMNHAASIENLQLEGLLPGVTSNTSAADFAPIKQFQLRKFKGERWELFGDIISSEVGG